ncbi:type IV-A pilus assembly ATPase PilB [Legionella rowbothamii]|uniref:type IV-A pilus assembly ATPase PilB n=1 Tax=Legionella rowbothamii TaxID=96229 RepID=UPI001F5FAF80|nr:type IV-A pilus assembly ATPase PilB [Legionella rowbothamii]
MEFNVAGQQFALEQFLGKAKTAIYYKQASTEKMSLAQYLIKNDILSATNIAQASAKSFGVPLLDLDSIEISTLPLSLVDEKLMLRHAMAPLFCRGTHLYLAAEDPSNHNGLKEIQFHTGLNTHAIAVEANKLTALFAHLLSLKHHQELSTYDTPIQHDDQYEFTINPIDSDDAPIVKFVNQILFKAIQQGASDIHFEPFEKEYRIRYRHDGILHEVASPPVNLSTRITSRIKVMAKLDISERRIPQDGSFKINQPTKHPIDFRVSTCPTTNGEKVVIRILDPDTAKLHIEALGFNPKQHEYFMRAIKRPQGMILVTGPTGSGKTVSLYAALNLLNTNKVNISTAEDPVEIKITGINQVNINPKVGLSFSKVLRSFLRQDPDIIMVGEIRDLETAEIAIKAAQTGHLVLSTLHTNSAVESLTRLSNIGIPSFNIVSSITLIIAQRLARKLCEQCKTPRTDLNKSNLLAWGLNETDQLYKAAGCSQCTDGYRGRIGLFEVLPMTHTLTELIMAGANSLDLIKAAQKEGMTSIYQSGIEKVQQGITTLEEVNRVTVE